MSVKNFEELEKLVVSLPPVSASVAMADDIEVLKSLKRGHDAGFLGTCHVTGDAVTINGMIREIGDDPSLYVVIPASSPAEAADLAVKAVREQGALILVKGSLKSEYYLKAILDRTRGIRRSPVLSNLSVFQMESYHKFLAVSDNAILIAPNLEEKAAVIRNSSPLWLALGIGIAKVAAIAAVETVNPKMPATTDAAGLSEMSRQGLFKGFIVEGPLGYDAAINRKCAVGKGLSSSSVCGDPDLILAPNLETANALGKSYKFHGGAVWGGLVFGASVPAVLNSRSDDEANRYKSLLLARAVADNFGDTSAHKVSDKLGGGIHG